MNVFENRRYIKHLEPLQIPKGIATLKYKYGRGTLLQFIVNSQIYHKIH